MKKFIAIILTFCLILCAFPLQAMAYPGDIWRPGKDGGEVKTMKLENGALALQERLSARNAAKDTERDISDHHPDGSGGAE